MDRADALRILHRTSEYLAAERTFLDLDPKTEKVQGFAVFDAAGRVKFGPTAEEVRAAILLLEKESQ